MRHHRKDGEDLHAMRTAEQQPHARVHRLWRRFAPGAGQARTPGQACTASQATATASITPAQRHLRRPARNYVRMGERSRAIGSNRERVGFWRCADLSARNRGIPQRAKRYIRRHGVRPDPHASGSHVARYLRDSDKHDTRLRGRDCPTKRERSAWPLAVSHRLSLAARANVTAVLPGKTYLGRCSWWRSSSVRGGFRRLVSGPFPGEPGNHAGIALALRWFAKDVRLVAAAHDFRGRAVRSLFFRSRRLAGARLLITQLHRHSDKASYHHPSENLYDHVRGYQRETPPSDSKHAMATDFAPLEHQAIHHADPWVGLH
jgi:hypothetical protein